MGTQVGESVLAYGTWGELGPVLAMALLLSTRAEWKTRSHPARVRRLVRGGGRRSREAKKPGTSCSTSSPRTRKAPPRP